MFEDQIISAWDFVLGQVIFTILSVSTLYWILRIEIKERAKFPDVRKIAGNILKGEDFFNKVGVIIADKAVSKYDFIGLQKDYEILKNGQERLDKKVDRILTYLEKQ